MDVSPGVVILGRWGMRGKSKVREIEGDHGRSHGRSREVTRDRARSCEIVGEVIREGQDYARRWEILSKRSESGVVRQLGHEIDLWCAR